MPSGSIHTVPVVIEQVLALRPKSVLDLGTGVGKYGVLLREYLEIQAGNFDFDQRRTVRIDGVEAEKRLCWRQDSIYDRMFWMDLREFVAFRVEASRRTVEYDLALMTDVFEHLSREDGAKVVDSLKVLCRAILIVVPRDWFSNEVPGLPWETHRTQWTLDDFRAFGMTAWEGVAGDLYGLWRGGT